MATVNFSVPEQVKKLFNAAFSGKNKSQVIADLMVKAVEERRRQKRRAKAIDALLTVRRRTMAVSDVQIRAARQRGRP
jgi:hypothetical protein